MHILKQIWEAFIILPSHSGGNHVLFIENTQISFLILAFSMPLPPTSSLPPPPCFSLTAAITTIWHYNLVYPSGGWGFFSPLLYFISQPAALLYCVCSV